MHDIEIVKGYNLRPPVLEIFQCNKTKFLISNPYINHDNYKTNPHSKSLSKLVFIFLRLLPWRIVPHPPHWYKGKSANSGRTCRHLGHWTNRTLVVVTPLVIFPQLWSLDEPKIALPTPHFDRKIKYQRPESSMSMSDVFWQKKNSCLSRCLQ